MKKVRKLFLPAAFLTLIVLLAACGSGKKVVSSNGDGGAKVRLTGAGSTFVYPFFSKIFDEYHQLHPQVSVNYQSIGSGAGIKQITEKTVAFGATDGPMTDEQLKAAPGILHIPVIMGAEAVIYNIPGIKSGLKLSSDVLAAIFLGDIKKWNDPRIVKLNPGLKLPNKDVLVVHRSDGSGTTYIFTDYLSKTSPQWKSKVGKSTSVNWPVGLGSKGNEGVAGQVSQTAGAIGYVELAYAVQNDFTYAVLLNNSGKFIKPTAASTSASADGIKLPADLRVSLVDSPNKKAYPITGFSWMLIYQNQKAAKGKVLADLAWWVVHDGQKYTKPLNYAPLPEAVVKMDEAKIKLLEANGKSLLDTK